MRPERLTRKSHLRKINLRNADSSETLLIDLTSSRVEECDSVVWDIDELIAEALCHGHGSDTLNQHIFETADDVLVWCARVADHSPTARKLAEQAASMGWYVTLGDLKNEGFVLDADNRLIVLDHFCLSPEALGRSAFFRNVILTTFIRALRDIWHQDKFEAPEFSYAPEHILMLERVRVADCDTVTILCGWELRAAGFTDIWRHLLGSEEGDMAIVFSRFLERDPGALFNGTALAYAFRQWYADASRVDSIDHDTLERLDEILADADGHNPFGQKKADALAIEDAATLPDGTRYLTGLGGAVARDPFFAGLNDPINQTHLFHLIHDMEVVMVGNVPFRDARLARLIFPESEVTRVTR